MGKLVEKALKKNPTQIKNYIHVYQKDMAYCLLACMVLLQDCSRWILLLQVWNACVKVADAYMLDMMLWEKLENAKVLSTQFNYLEVATQK